MFELRKVSLRHFPPCGILVPARDPAALAEALLRFIADRRLTKEISEKALNRAKSFSSDRFCGDILGLSRQFYHYKGNV